MFSPQRDHPLAPLTTLELGGKARYFADIHSLDELHEALRWAHNHHVALQILGDGSNIIVADEGVPAFVLRLGLKGIVSDKEAEGRIFVQAAAGESWDALVEYAVTHNLAGIECLSGIPGRVGAAPIQNIGAYGQDIAQCMAHLEAIHRETLETRRFDASECGFSYRQSRFKQPNNPWIITSVTYALRAQETSTISYRELKQALGSSKTTTSFPLAQIRKQVLALRKSKSMLRSSDDPNRRSVGSFFVNPIIPTQHVQALQEAHGATIPQWPVSETQSKLSAAWLIEQSGFYKGQRQGAVGISSKHALCLVHHGHGSSEELLGFAKQIQTKVFECFAINLEIEPSLWLPHAT